MKKKIIKICLISALLAPQVLPMTAFADNRITDQTMGDTQESTSTSEQETSSSSTDSEETSNTSSGTTEDSTTESSSSAIEDQPTETEESIEITPETSENQLQDSSSKNAPIVMTKNQTTEQFIQTIGELARKIAYENDLYASVMIAQAILESASGNSGLSVAPYYNLFGIKGNYQGASVMMQTQEDNGQGELYTINDGFRQYPSYKESLEDYMTLLKEGISGNPTFYMGTWKSQAIDYKQASAFLTGRYATDTQYAEKLNQLIEVYELTQFDKLKEDTKAQQIQIAEQSEQSKQEQQNQEKISKMIQRIKEQIKEKHVEQEAKERRKQATSEILNKQRKIMMNIVNFLKL